MSKHATDHTNFTPTVTVCQQQHSLCPQSKGTIRLKSSDPLVYPIVDPKYLSNPIDIEICMQATKRARAIVKQEASKPGSYLTGAEIVMPEIAHLGQETDEYIREFIRRRAVTVYHPTSTCKMGQADDPSTVVDTRLRVHGIQGLRVVDASAFPTVPTGNTNAPCIMLAERAVDMIREDWGDAIAL
jgi:choline dehydrogenase